MTEIIHAFAFGDKVVADGDISNPMVVGAFLYSPTCAVSVKCFYWCNGDHKEVWIDLWRLTAFVDPRRGV